MGFRIGNVAVGLDAPLFLMAGPCVMESEELCLQIAARLVQISAATGVGIIFKASFDKANRSSISSYRGPGLTEGMKILAKVRRATGLPVMTDVHEPAQAVEAAKTVDCLQVPAFLCRQTDLLCACAGTGRPVSIKKGQFLSPAEMGNVVEKMRACKNDKIILTERGTFFGYNRLVNDMTGLAVMQQLGCPVVFDATHSTQQPGGLGAASGGRREMAPLLARAAVAAGANGLFLEVHPKPDQALSDAASMLPLDWLPDLVRVCRGIFEITHGHRQS
ncbi:MAG: 3-deoxy-8-phosphooctulonate synthase [Planctomycetes bacterium]|jgi:2-dehydro-3-deoxyphosphooctonate aldolase (KDO 8-P synthase)|nr:3-deoxy-8-phosphooctulonate synthase [Planctomycetota bacterium]